jgi:AraC-like DNA-binding protein
MEKWTGEGDLNDISMLISVITVILGVLRDDGESFDNLSLDANSIYDGITYIHNNFAEDITAEQVAERVNMSYSFFARSFKAATGKTFKEYLNITRMNEAEQLLVNTDLPISEVAIRCGYNSVAYFTSLYKQYKGNTPRSERK